MSEDTSGSKNCTSELLALPRDSFSTVDEHGDAQTNPDSGACGSCGVETVVSISRVYSHSSIGEPGDSGSMSKSKYASADSEPTLLSCCVVLARRGCRSVMASVLLLLLLLFDAALLIHADDASTTSVSSCSYFLCEKRLNGKSLLIKLLLLFAWELIVNFVFFIYFTLL